LLVATEGVWLELLIKPPAISPSKGQNAKEERRRNETKREE
jgi:hypothetical protein